MLNSYLGLKDSQPNDSEEDVRQSKAIVSVWSDDGDDTEWIVFTIFGWPFISPCHVPQSHPLKNPIILFKSKLRCGRKSNTT